jgi:hypothetical protein
MWERIMELAAGDQESGGQKPAQKAAQKPAARPRGKVKEIKA